MRPIIFGIVGLLYFIYCTEEGSALNCYQCQAKVGNGSDCESGKSDSNTTCQSSPDSNETLACFSIVVNESIALNCYQCRAQLGNGSNCESGKDMDPAWKVNCFPPISTNKTVACVAGVRNNTIIRDCGNTNTCNEKVPSGYYIKWCKNCTTDLCNTQTSSVSIITPTLLTPIIIFTAVLTYF
ncbi:uncharacterized protein LOC114333892 isoform X2 [Diabrotica virgifera virgifera]|uniref:Protein sleepless n=1 Tax=Diabrotica virgifera virgifera TaxID=50390 RepID=A0ABM5KSG7_DIAVI|nr:uncharacterized protein LOC114333892 isoform X2 [Diabrotica virgifera virgifera]